MQISTILENKVAQTDRLILRRLIHNDIDFFHHLFSHPEVMKYYPSLRSREETQAWIEFNHKHYEMHGHGKWVIIRKRDGALLGHTGLMVADIDGTSEVELGYFLDYQCWGQGYATEAAMASMKLGYLQYGYKRLVSAINPLNFPSIQVAKRLGMVMEKSGKARVGDFSWDCDVYATGRP